MWWWWWWWWWVVCLCGWVGERLFGGCGLCVCVCGGGGCSRRISCSRRPTSRPSRRDARARKHTHPRASTRTHARARARLLACTHTHTHATVIVRTQEAIEEYPHTPTRPLAHTHANTHANTRTRALARTHASKQARARTHRPCLRRVRSPESLMAMKGPRGCRARR